MLLKEEKQMIIDFSLKALNEGMTNGTSGNISIINRKNKLIAITPTGVNYQEMKLEDISIIDLDGKLIEGLKPSSEWYMHLLFYKEKPEINSVFHGHTTYSTIVACLGEDLPAIDYMIGVSGDIKVPCAEYATYGTKELANNALAKGKHMNAVLLRNHGILTYSKNIQNAYNIACQIEYVAKLYINALQTGKKPIIIDDKEMHKLLEKFKVYGQV